MAPARRYRMAARADAVEQTRADIVAAAMALHAERGVLNTSWEEIAERAGVSPTTVYRHYPSLAELVPACARTVFDLIRPPTVDEATQQFARLPTAPERFAHLVSASVHCYESGEGWLHAAHRERSFVPELDAALVIIEDTLWVLLEGAAGQQLKKADQRILFVLCDFPLWRSFVARGLTRRAAERAVIGLVHGELARMGLS